MKFIRWVISFLIIILLFILVFIQTVFTPVAITLTNRNNLKTWLKDSNTYEKILPEIFKNADLRVEESTNGNADEGQGIRELLTNLKDPNSELGKLVSEKLTPSFFENSVNKVIDGTYDWLEGKTDKIEFEVKIAKDREEMIHILTVLFEEKYKSLPDCEESIQLDSNYDPLSAHCKAPGYDTNSISTFIQKNLNTPEFQRLIDSTTISSNQLKIDEQFTQNVQNAYVGLSYGPIILALIIAILIGLLLLLIPSQKKHVLGFYICGGVLIFEEVILLGSTAYLDSKYSDLITFITEKIDKNSADLFTNLGEPILKLVFNDLVGKQFLIEGVILVVGVVLVGVGVWMSKNSGKASILH